MHQLYANFAAAIPAFLGLTVIALTLAGRFWATGSPRTARETVGIYILIAIGLGALWPHGGPFGRPLQLVPFEGMVAMFRDPNLRVTIGLSNVMLFVPFGIIVPNAWPRIAGALWRSAVLAAGFAVLLEASQYVLGNHEISVNDVILNTAGAVVGYGIMWSVRTTYRAAVRRGPDTAA